MPALDRKTLRRPLCGTCTEFHDVGGVCPTRGVWLVSNTCAECWRLRGRRLCRRHERPENRDAPTVAA